VPCLVALLAYFAPRLAIVLLVIFSDYLGTAYQTRIVPFLGFLLVPLTTLAYAWAIHSRGSVEGLALVVVLLALLMDLGIIGRAARERGKRARSER
jgi:hypothetical protein